MLSLGPEVPASYTKIAYVKREGSGPMAEPFPIYAVSLVCVYRS